MWTPHTFTAPGGSRQNWDNLCATRSAYRGDTPTTPIPPWCSCACRASFWESGYTACPCTPTVRHLTRTQCPYVALQRQWRRGSGQAGLQRADRLQSSSSWCTMLEDVHGRFLHGHVAVPGTGPCLEVASQRAQHVKVSLVFQRPADPNHRSVHQQGPRADCRPDLAGVGFFRAVQKVPIRLRTRRATFEHRRSHVRRSRVMGHGIRCIATRAHMRISRLAGRLNVEYRYRLRKSEPSAHAPLQGLGYVAVRGAARMHVSRLYRAG